MTDAASTPAPHLATPPAPEPLGTVARCWRYPVKSLQGVELPRLTIGAEGVEGDRTFGLLDAAPGASGRLLSAKRSAALLEAAATDDAITLPDGRTVVLDAPDVDDVLSAWLGRPVRLARPTANQPVSYEMTFDPPDEDAEVFDIPTPTASFVDLAPVHLVATATLAACAEARPDLDWDVRRFRPNLLVDVDGPPFVEGTWLGRHLQVGGAVLSIDTPTVRCAMPLRAQPGGIEREPELFRAMNELNTVSPNHLGAYCSVVEPGTVAAGDPVVLR
ncbi:MAG TPA: MOSC domain-containing protein [Aquihabitans sp.]|nr:MOSC domain-containing protein [Aquihabitans sp.]